MDPNAALAEIALALATIGSDTMLGSPALDTTELDDSCEGLAEWLDKHGFAPEWHRHPEASGYFKLWMGVRLRNRGAE